MLAKTMLEDLGRSGGVVFGDAMFSRAYRRDLVTSRWVNTSVRMRVVAEDDKVRF